MATACEKLTSKERLKLRKYLRAKHGNLEKSSRDVGLHKQTITRASMGFELKPDNLKKIRETLLETA